MIRVLFVTAGFLGIAALPAQSKQAQSKQPPKAETQEQKKPKPLGQPKLDELGKLTIAKWSTLEYRAARHAIRKIAFDIDVESKGGMTGTWKAKTRFQFDKTKASRPAYLKWQEEDVAHALERRGWVASAFANAYRDQPIRHLIAGATVVSTKRKNGTILQATGGRVKDKQMYLIFDKPGVLVGTMIGPLRKRHYYAKRGELFVPNGETYQMPKTNGDVTITYGTVQGHHIPVKVREVVKVEGKLLSDLTFTFSKHAIQTAKGKKKKDAEPSKPKKEESKKE